MSDEPIGDDWWQASDGKWYPPETHPDRVVTETPAAPEPDPKRGTFSVLPDPVPGERVLIDPDTVPTPGDRTGPDQPAGSPLFGTSRSGGEGSTWAPGGATSSGAPAGTGGLGAPPGSGAPAGMGGPSIGATPSMPAGAPNLTPRSTPASPADTAKTPKGRGKKGKPAKAAKPGKSAKAGAGAGGIDAGRPSGVATAGGEQEDVRSNRTVLMLGAAAALVAVAAAVYFLFLSGDDSEVADVPASVKSETTTSANNSAAPSTTAAGGTATTVAVDPNDPDGACRQALVAEDQAQAFQVCDAYQFRRLQPEVAPNRPDLDTACKQVTYGDACIFIPTTLPPPAFEPVQATGQGSGSVAIPGAASSGIVEIRNDGAGPLTVAGSNGVLAERPGGSTSSLYIGDLSTTGTLTVTAQGPWTVTVKPPTQARDATLRAVGFGPDVVFLDNPTEKSVHFTHDGAGQFTVIGHPLVGADATGSVALDQAGPVDTSVVVRGAIIEIRATGNWTLIPE